MSIEFLAVSAGGAVGLSNGFGGSFGSEFTPVNAISVISLGAYVDPSTPWIASKTCKLYRNSDQSVLAAATILPTDVANGLAVQIGQMVYKAITPVAVPVGTTCRYAISGYNNDKFENGSPGTVDSSGNLTLSGGSFVDPGGGYPSTPAGGSNPVTYSVSFQYTVTTATPSIVISPSTATAGTPLSITITGTHTSWTTATTFAVAGGTGASLSGLAVNATTQVATATLNPGSAAGTLAISDNTDAATGSVAVSGPTTLVFGSPLTLTSNTPSGGTTLGITAATGGSGTKTYKLYRSASPMVTTSSGTLAATGTTLSLTDATPGTGIVYYLATCTDTTGTALSAQSTYQVCLCVQVKSSQVNLVLAGDSITAGTGASNAATTSAAALLAAHITTIFPQALVTSVNQGAGGTTSVDWVNGTNGASATNL